MSKLDLSILNPATDQHGHPITQRQWDRVMRLLASWFDSKADSAEIVAEVKAILREDAEGDAE